MLCRIMQFMKFEGLVHGSSLLTPKKIAPSDLCHRRKCFHTSPRVSQNKSWHSCACNAERASNHTLITTMFRDQSKLDEETEPFSSQSPHSTLRK